VIEKETLMVDALEAMADAHQHIEGWAPTTRSYRNRNPGNLRPTDPAQPRDAENYRKFATVVEGYEALIGDVRAKFTGHNAHSIGPQSSLLEYASIYAPAGDHNAPVAYARQLAGWLTFALLRTITPATLLGEIWSVPAAPATPVTTV
jgi:hypothetical protein